ncbi:MAG: signal peptidase I [bacterium]|nr:signal peptidase I [bacterium]
MKKKYSSENTYYILVSLYLVFLMIIAIFSLKIFDNIRSFTNVSGSMSPVIDTGSVTIVKKFDEYNVGDIITYYALVNKKEEIITHRILAIGGNVYITKGDANVAQDREIVLPRLIIGKVIVIIPYLGYLISLVKSPIGLIITIFIPAGMIIFIELSKVVEALK